ncbi:MAG: A/G-specific adenine glycosylase [Thermodesulfobacteriota bacterium]|nr:A/G-specific adenine glycosylase [Thermodesulfobacteriota bacterium]
MELKAFQQHLTRWYETHQRALPWRKSRDPYHIWISEVLLQQTQVATVVGYYRRFFRAFPNVQAPAGADHQDILKLWEGLGYYSRARHLHAAANQINNAPEKLIPADPEAFRRLPGVGNYINAAVQSIAFGHPLAVVDGNVKRVLARLFMMDEPVNLSKSHKVFAAKAETLLDHTDPGTFNQAMMEMGALICKPGKPLCDECPVAPFCLALRKQKTHAFPKRVAARKTPHHHLTVGIIQKNGTLLIVKRPEPGLLGGLWEFPGGRLKEQENPETGCQRTIQESVGLTITVGERLTRVKHAYTHFKITMDVYFCDYIAGRVRRNGPAGHQWIRPSAITTFPFHKAVHKSLPALYEFLQK